MLWLALALVLLLAGCGGGNLLVAGEFTEAEVEDGRLDSVVLRSRSTGKEVFVQLTEDTTVMPILEGATAEELLDGEGITGRLELEADCSTLTGICTAREIQITGARRGQGITLSDGTAVEIWDTAFFRYQLYPARRHGAPAGEQAQRAAERACGRCGGL